VTLPHQEVEVVHVRGAYRPWRASISVVSMSSPWHPTPLDAILWAVSDSLKWLEDGAADARDDLDLLNGLASPTCSGMTPDDTEAAVAAVDLTFTARTEPYALRRGTMRWRDEVVWDQSHMFQAGVFNGSYTRNGVTHEVRNWIGQRDHSWGIRNHQRCPMWMWLALQFDDEMLGVWHWEYANGAPVYTDGCAAPALATNGGAMGSGGGEPVPLVGFSHDLHFTDAAGNVVDYGRDGLEASGLAGRVVMRFADGRVVTVDGEGERAAPYGERGGGQYLLRITADDGRTGVGIYEVTGAHHHRFFPVPRGERLPPG
jgi:hypothetical protein